MRLESRLPGGKNEGAKLFIWLLMMIRKMESAAEDGRFIIEFGDRQSGHL